MLIAAFNRRNGAFNLSPVPQRVRNYVANTPLHFRIEIRVVEIMRLLRGRIMQDGGALSRPLIRALLPGGRGPETPDRLQHAAHGAFSQCTGMAGVYLTNRPGAVTFQSVAIAGAAALSVVMAGLDPAIHVFLSVMPREGGASSCQGRTTDERSWVARLRGR